MSLQPIDAETAETLAGVVRLLRRAAELVWKAVDTDGAGSPRQVLALGIDLPPTRRGTSCRMPLRPMDLCQSDMIRLVFYALPSSCCGAWTPKELAQPCMSCGSGWPTWCGRRTPVSTPDRRAVGELLADSEALARETLVDATLEQAPAMVRSWNQLVGSAADLWAVLPFTDHNPSGSDLMERLRVIGEAIGRSVTAGHWPGQGPAEEHLMEIAEKLSRAQHLVERPARNSQPTSAEKQPDIQGPSAQVMHTLYVAAHGTAVALNAYLADLKDRLEMGRRRRRLMAERPTALEITEAQGMIARFGGFEQLAVAYLFGEPRISPNPGLVRSAALATRLRSALAAWEIQAHRTIAADPDPADLVRVARVQVLITTTTGILRSRSQKRPCRSRDDPAARAGAGSQPSGLEPRGETLGRADQPSQPHRPGARRGSQRSPRRDCGDRHESRRMGNP
jgi:hypothetical protein